MVNGSVGERREPGARSREAAPPVRRIRRILEAREAVRVLPGEPDRRAAVVLVLRLPDREEGAVRPGPTAPSARGGSPSPADREVEGGGRPLPRTFARLEALFVVRARRDDDPWSGHVGLPGGHQEPGDEDLRAAARRELREEVSLEMEPEAILGRLDDVHPRSSRLPSVAVTPFVAWLETKAAVRHGPEVAGHRWVPLAELEAPDRRTILTFRREGALRVFPAVEVGGLTIWGLTFAIVQRFLDELPREPARGEQP